jgi:flagellar protein FlaG
METKSIEQVSPVLTSASADLDKQQILERRELVRAVHAINATELFGENYELTFVFDRQSKRTLIRIIDRETKEVIRQLPNEYALRIASQLRAE